MGTLQTQWNQTDVKLPPGVGVSFSYITTDLQLTQNEPVTKTAKLAVWQVASQ